MFYWNPFFTLMLEAQSWISLPLPPLLVSWACEGFTLCKNHRKRFEASWGFCSCLSVSTMSIYFSETSLGIQLWNLGCVSESMDRFVGLELKSVSLSDKAWAHSELHLWDYLMASRLSFSYLQQQVLEGTANKKQKYGLGISVPSQRDLKGTLKQAQKPTPFPTGLFKPHDLFPMGLPISFLSPGTGRCSQMPSLSKPSSTHSTMAHLLCLGLRTSSHPLWESGIHSLTHPRSLLPLYC